MTVSGELGFDYKFEDTNILLGTNESGKTTFVNLLLYGLGVKIGMFVDEISKQQKCEYVHLSITTKNNNSFKITRKLPDVDYVTVLPLSSNGNYINEDVKILNLSEYSDFLLDEEQYKKVSITYSATKSATLTYRFLIRAVLVDQFTPPTKILANIQGDRNDFMNNQELLNTAIIEQLLNTLNQELQKLKLEYKTVEKERNFINEQISVYKNLNIELTANTKYSFKKIEKLDEELQRVIKEKDELDNFKYEQLKNIEKSNDDNATKTISDLRKYCQKIKNDIVFISFECDDLKQTLLLLNEELNKIKAQFAAQKVLMEIPVTICPVCFSEIEHVEENGLCPHCKDANAQEVLEGIASYKRTIEDAIKEVTILSKEKSQQKRSLELELFNKRKELSVIENEYFNKIQKSTETFNGIIEELQVKIEDIVKSEYQLNELRKVMVQLNVLKSKKDKYNRNLEEIREEIAENEKKSGNDSIKFMTFENTYKEIFEKIYGVNHDIVIQQENYMPIIDGTVLSQNSNHSASIKVVARLAYILTLYLLNNYLTDTKINNMQYIIFDSPREKDLDIDKYKRFLEILRDQHQGQVFLTGSYRDIDTFNEVFTKKRACFIDNLSDESKLLKKQH